VSTSAYTRKIFNIRVSSSADLVLPVFQSDVSYADKGLTVVEPFGPHPVPSGTPWTMDFTSSVGSLGEYLIEASRSDGTLDVTIAFNDALSPSVTQERRYTKPQGEVLRLYADGLKVGEGISPIKTIKFTSNSGTCSVRGYGGV